jgi:serine/threonine-protein kinase RsbW
MADRPPITIIDDNDGLRSSLERSLRSDNQPVVAKQPDGTQRSKGSKIFLEFPSDLEFLERVTGYLIRRTEQAWSLPNGSCTDLSIALSEAIINAIKHGNESDPAKLVRISADVSDDEARFTVEDEGAGFDVRKVPHPRDPDNLLKTSGRGVLLIQSIMDEAHYNDPGNRVTMIKRRASLVNDEPVKFTSRQ